MQRSQKARNIVCTLHQLLQEPAREEEQFEQIHAHILQIVDDGEMCAQIAKASMGYTDRQYALLPLTACNNHSDRKLLSPPVSQMTDNTAFRTELLARFLLVMLKK